MSVVTTIKQCLPSGSTIYIIIAEVWYTYSNLVYVHTGTEVQRINDIHLFKYGMAKHTWLHWKSFSKWNFSIETTPFFSLKHSTVAVSYTHLDVYKRQGKIPLLKHKMLLVNNPIPLTDLHQNLMALSPLQFKMCIRDS